MTKVSCIIPAFNEEPRIVDVLNVVSKHLLIDEILVIDDQSTDGTADKVRLFSNVKLLLNKKNCGKSFSVARGIEESTGEYLFFLDADLVGISEKDVSNLLLPVINQEVDVSISLRRNSPLIWRLIGLDYISGDRVMPRKILSARTAELKMLPKFGLEVFMNTLIIKNRSRIKIVVLKNVDSPYKYRKYGLICGIKGEAKMMYDIFSTVSFFQVLFQIRSMLKLRV